MTPNKISHTDPDRLAVTELRLFGSGCLGFDFVSGLFGISVDWGIEFMTDEKKRKKLYKEERIWKRRLFPCGCILRTEYLLLTQQMAGFFTVIFQVLTVGVTHRI